MRFIFPFLSLEKKGRRTKEQGEGEQLGQEGEKKKERKTPIELLFEI